MPRPRLPRHEFNLVPARTIYRDRKDSGPAHRTKRYLCRQREPVARSAQRIASPGIRGAVRPAPCRVCNPLPAEPDEQFSDLARIRERRCDQIVAKSCHRRFTSLLELSCFPMIASPGHQGMRQTAECHRRRLHAPETAYIRRDAPPE